MSRRKRVAKVTDGDSSEAPRRRRPVRPANADAPEPGASRGRTAKRDLGSLVADRTVSVDIVAGGRHDRATAGADANPRAAAEGKETGALDATRLGSRLRMARERRGLSQQAVAKALNLPRTAVTNMESGGRAVSTLELTRLAEVYGHPAASFLVVDEEPEAEELPVALRRALPEMEHAPKVKAEVERLLDLCREGAVLQRLLGQMAERSIPSYAMQMKNVGDAIRQGEAVAQEERRRLGLGDAPIRNIAGCIGGQGIWTAATALPKGLSGLFVNHPTVRLAILVNRKHRPVRRCFSYSHEYAHALFDRSETVTTTRQENSSELMEKRANAFAAAFLMPPGGVREQLARIDKGRPSRLGQIIFDVASDSTTEAEVRARPGSQSITYQDAAVLARHFGVGFEAVVWRLKNLNHIGVNERASLIARKEIGDKCIKLLGPQDLPEEDASHEASEQELRGRVMHLAIEAFRQEEISLGRLVEIGRKLAIGRDEMIELADAAHPEC